MTDTDSLQALDDNKQALIGRPDDLVDSGESGGLKCVETIQSVISSSMPP
jgi:hypothetical protein